MNEFADKKQKGIILAKKSSMVLVEFDTIDDYLSYSENFIRKMKDEKPAVYFLNKIIFKPEWIQFLIRDLVIEEQKNQYKKKPEGIKWYKFSKKGQEIDAFFDFSERSPYLYGGSRIETSGTNIGDLVTVFLSAPIGQSEKYSEIYQLRNQKYL
jgi:hypothetical protein